MALSTPTATMGVGGATIYTYDSATASGTATITTPFAKIHLATATWTEDIGTTASVLECVIAANVVTVTESAASPVDKSFNIMVVGRSGG